MEILDSVIVNYGLPEQGVALPRNAKLIDLDPRYDNAAILTYLGNPASVKELRTIFRHTLREEIDVLTKDYLGAITLYGTRYFYFINATWAFNDYGFMPPLKKEA